MNQPLDTAIGGAWRIRLVLFILTGIIYVATPRIAGERVSHHGHFPRFASAFLEGRLSIGYQPGDVIDELIPSVEGDRLFLPYPPLPSVLLMPVVWLFGSGVITSQLACRVLSAANVVLFDECLNRMSRLIGRPPPTTAERLALDAFFAFGTVAWHNAHFGGDWHLAHAVSLSALLTGLYEFGGMRRPLAIGLCIAAAFLTRPTAGLCGLFFLLSWLRTREFRKLFVCCEMVVLGFAILGMYNFARFGNPLDFGYSRMLLIGLGQHLMTEYGQFHVHFLPRNFFWYFLSPPWVTAKPPARLAYDPRGLSLFIASPAFLYAYLAVIRHRTHPLLREAMTAILLTLIPLLLYFNSGFWQFGHRFSMDYLPVLLLLMIWGMGPRSSRTAWLLIGLSVVIQGWGIFFATPMALPDWLAPLP